MNCNVKNVCGDDIRADTCTPISVLVPVKNEAQNIEACLKSVDWCDDVHVVDSHSDDGTVEIVKKCAAHLHQFEYDGKWPKKKNWALETLTFKYEWVLILDADERVSPALQEEMTDAVTRRAHNGYYIKWKFFFQGSEMKHCWGHGWMLRLFKHRLGRYENLGMTGQGGWDVEVHENVVLSHGTAGKLKEPLVHFSQKDLTSWLIKQDQFAVWTAELRLRHGALYAEYGIRDWFGSDSNRKRKAIKRLFLMLPFKSVLVFICLYFLKLGFLDGLDGLTFCWLRAAHEASINHKMRQMRKTKDGVSAAQ